MPNVLDTESAGVTARGGAFRDKPGGFHGPQASAEFEGALTAVPYARVDIVVRKGGVQLVGDRDRIGFGRNGVDILGGYDHALSYTGTTPAFGLPSLPRIGA